MKRILTTTLGVSSNSLSTKKNKTSDTINEDLIIEESIDEPNAILPSFVNVDQTNNAENNDVSAVSPAIEKLSKHYLFDGNYYKITSSVDNKLIAECQLCNKTINGQLNSTGNFLSHIKVCTK